MSEPEEYLVLKQLTDVLDDLKIDYAIGGSIAMSHSLPLIMIGWLIYLVETALLSIGFGFYVRSKGRSPAWCSLAMLSIIGWVVLILFKDKSLSSLNQENPKVKSYI